MSWSIAQVARMSKVTSRTLRHYDEIGLLPPAHVGANGYRYYGRSELVRLQQILVLRELGLGLDAIATALSGERDTAEVLRRHHRWLVAEQQRLATLARSVAKALTEQEGGEDMDPAEWFDGFDAGKQARYEAELVERYGDAAAARIAETRRRMRGWSRPDVDRIRREATGVTERIVALLDAGVPAGDPRTLDAFGGHYAWITHFWTPNRESYTGLGELYVDSPEFRLRYDTERPGLAEYLRDGMAAYAQARLS